MTAPRDASGDPKVGRDTPEEGAVATEVARDTGDAGAVTASEQGENDLEASEAVSRWLKSLLASDAARLPTPNLLPGVQRRIRQRSRGKFFADGWSTATTRATPAILGVITLSLVALAYYALIPWPLH